MGSNDVASPDTGAQNNTVFMTAIFQFGFSSICMMIGNKAAVDHLRLPCTLVIIQALGTLGLLAFCRSNLQRFSPEVAKQWFPIALLFALMLFTSLKSFVYVGVSTVLILRNVGAIITTVTEYFVRGVTVNAKIIASELLIVIGAAMYGHGSLDFNLQGAFWIFTNVAGQVAYGVLVKHRMDVHPHFADMSKYTMSMYNNLLAIPLVFIALLLQGEQIGIQEKMEAVSIAGWLVILSTCVVGFMISTSGFGLQKLVSATTFLVINNVTKFVNIGLGMMFLNDRLAGFMDATGCVVALGAGFWYSYETMEMNKAKAEKARTAGQ